MAENNEIKDEDTKFSIDDDLKYQGEKFGFGDCKITDIVYSKSTESLHYIIDDSNVEGIHILGCNYVEDNFELRD